MYEFKEFPKYLHYADRAPILVQDETEQAAVPEGWADNPGAFVNDDDDAAGNRLSPQMIADDKTGTLTKKTGTLTKKSGKHRK